MIVTKIQHFFDYINNYPRTKVYKTLEDPVTHKEYITSELYINKGIIEQYPDKGKNIDTLA